MTKIIGKSVATADQMAAYLLSKNSAPKINMPVRDFCQLFLTVAAEECVRGDGLFAQSCWETNHFKYTGTVTPDQNNYAGIGTLNANTKGAYFKDEAEGILAQAQHAKTYATKDPLNRPCVDPRRTAWFVNAKGGTSPDFETLGGTWAVPGYDTKKYASLDAANKAHDSYGYKITNILNEILSMPKGSQTEQEETKVRTKIIALDAGHGMYTSGKRCLKSIDANQTREWYLNDRIMDRVEELLAGYECKTIRVDDTTGAKDISLSSRVNTANNAKADVYIAMHHNAGINGGTGGGTMVFYYSDKSERMVQAQKLYNEIVNRTGLVGNRSAKVKKYPYYVIKNTNMPAFLVENGYMDSKADVPVILSAAHAEKTAQGVLSFLVGEFNLEKKKGAGNGTQGAQNGNSTDSNTQTGTVTLDVYVVIKGDTLSKIGEKVGIPWKKIADLNGLKHPYTIRVGQVLKLRETTYYPAYTGKNTTLTSALTSLGINSSFSNRKKIAAANNITGYVGTSAQNTRIYNLLKAGLLKKAV